MQLSPPMTEDLQQPCHHVPRLLFCLCARFATTALCPYNKLRSCLAPLACLWHARPDGHRLQRDRREPSSLVLTACQGRCSKDEKPWADQLAPELPPEATPADSAPAPVTPQEALSANPETEVPKPCPLPSAPHWPNAPDLPQPSKRWLTRRRPSQGFRATEASASAPAQGACDWPQPSSGFHAPKPDLQYLDLGGRTCTCL